MSDTASTAAPLIGITGRTHAAGMIGAPKGFADAPLDVHLNEYASSVIQAGGLPVHIPMGVDTGAIVSRLDGLIIAGGEDVDPRRYGRQPDPRTSSGDGSRDELEIGLLQAALAQRVPVLGICRGQQLINVALGGTLIQHLEGAQGLRHNASEIHRYERVHEVSFRSGSVLHRIYGDGARVNSFHHQAVERLGTGLSAVGHADDGVIEAVELADADVIGVQWHPECFGSDPVFHWFARTVIEARQGRVKERV